MWLCRMENGEHVWHQPESAVQTHTHSLARWICQQWGSVLSALGLLGKCRTSAGCSRVSSGFSHLGEQQRLQGSLAAQVLLPLEGETDKMDKTRQMPSGGRLWWAAGGSRHQEKPPFLPLRNLFPSSSPPFPTAATPRALQWTEDGIFRVCGVWMGGMKVPAEHQPCRVHGY